MSTSIATLGDKSFTEFSILLHKTLERCSSEGDKSDFSFYIPSESLSVLHSKENRLTSSKGGKKQGEKICVVAGFPYTGLQKLLLKSKSLFGGDPDRSELKRTLIRILELEEHDYGRMGLPDRFHEIIESEILGVIVDLNKADDFYDKNLSRILNEYLKQKSSHEKNLFFVLNLPWRTGKKLIPKIHSKKDQAEIKLKVGKRLMKRDFERTWRSVSEQSIDNFDIFFTTYSNVSRIHPKIHPKLDGLEPTRVHSKVLIYPFFQYLDILSFISNTTQDSKSQKDVISEVIE